ncbi:MAG: ABC transporter permease [Bacillaceae bacterium]|nr:ABC transporter permease [Bacillaceae bacterium]
MIYPLIKKQFLLVIRNRRNFTLLLVMPLVLVFIINFAVGDLWQGEAPVLEGKLAIAEHGDEEEDLERIKREIADIPITDDQRNLVLQRIEQFKPIHILKTQVFGSDDLKQFIQLEEVSPEQIDILKKSGEYAAILEVPEGFTYHIIMNMFGVQTEKPAFHYYINEDKDFTAGIVMDILAAFEEEMKVNMLFERYDLQEFRVSSQDIQGSVVTVSKTNPLTSTMYYAVGMSVMFVLYIASTIGTYAYEEKRIHVFERIILASSSRWAYVASIFLTGTLLSIIQLFILYGVGSVIFKVNWPNINQFLLITLFLSMSVGALSTLLTAINYRTHSEQASSVFSNMIVSIIAFLGGSFFPVHLISSFIEKLGNLTPNGAAMSAYLTSLQGYGYGEIGNNLLYLIIFSFVITLIAAFIFPKRGEVA